MVKNSNKHTKLYYIKPWDKPLHHDKIAIRGGVLLRHLCNIILNKVILVFIPCQDSDTFCQVLQ